MLVYAAVLMAWSCGQSLLDRFTEARGCLDEIFSSRRRMQEISGEHWLRDGFASGSNCDDETLRRHAM